ncbi:WUSCHEL-related homeobox 11-like isoform X2 [Actinidia eriantha]|uniref:WUSCHEL-related homeobox 11-like isoform X1 n=1 Tax=Actinidia eriantha TaxID=165200 RepID=UPI0025846DC0|nr:WUSCHEL-related homeobox 11-like isoform X1 [Actinidia eriantha]XP_057513259.1 WUSCHEL-related homeobox 11-like isoform X2 [Actinidia eriantha]
MEEDPNNNSSPIRSHGGGDQRNNEPVRSRWTPKPEQILILESIFNSGMVNPPKDETVRIRKLLEKFGAVGDANVFYWFQNRRSRSRRRQRQIQASLAAAGEQQQQISHTQSYCDRGSGSGSGAIYYQYESGSGSDSVPGFVMGPSSSSCGTVDDLFTYSAEMGLPGVEHNSSMDSILCPSNTSNLQYQSGMMTVFINGVATAVGRGPIDVREMFGEDVVLVHPSGIPVLVNEDGFSAHTLQHGESYFLVSKPT